MATWVLLFATLACAYAATDYTIQQLPLFAERTGGPIGTLTTSAGAPVEKKDLSSINTSFLRNEFFMDMLTHLTHQVNPERIVHARGHGAFGYLNITSDALSKYTKAKLFSDVGKVTPLVARFSRSTGSRGTQDTVRGGRGIAFKFYTEEGNLDILTMNAPVFGIKDPNTVLGFMHTLLPNPVTNLPDPNMTWDFLLNKPEAFNVYLRIFADKGLPDGYRYMPGYAVHTYQVYNENNETHFLKFRFEPVDGVKFLNNSYALSLKASDPDYSGRDLYNAIAAGNYPTWKTYFQILTPEQVSNSSINLFDVTVAISEEEFPLIEYGEIVLNQNPTNWFEDIEQLAFNPGNLVPGIVGGPDKTFEARRFTYRDAQKHRLGVNFNNIAVNRPLNTPYTYNRDGAPPQSGIEGDAPYYYPNTFNGPVPVANEKPDLINVYVEPEATNFGQASTFYESCPEDEKDRIVTNLANSIAKAEDRLKYKAVEVLAQINSDLSSRFAAAANLTSTSS